MIIWASHYRYLRGPRWLLMSTTNITIFFYKKTSGGKLVGIMTIERQSVKISTFGQQHWWNLVVQGTVNIMFSFVTQSSCADKVVWFQEELDVIWSSGYIVWMHKYVLLVFVWLLDSVLISRRCGQESFRIAFIRGERVLYLNRPTSMAIYRKLNPQGFSLYAPSCCN